MRHLLRTLGLGLSLLLAASAASFGQTPPAPAFSDYVFPGREWTAAPAAELGWSTEKLAAAARRAGDLDTGGLMVVDRGHLVLSVGNVRARFAA